MYSLKYEDINKKATWEMLPPCPRCGDKLSYSQLTRRLKKNVKMGLFDDTVKAGDHPRFTIVCHNMASHVELQIHDIGTRVNNLDYFSNSYVVRDYWNPGYYLIKWTSSGYIIESRMSDNFRGEHLEV